MRLFQLVILLRAVAGVTKSLLNPGMVFFRIVLTVFPERISSVVSISLMARLTNQSTIIELEGIELKCSNIICLYTSFIYFSKPINHIHLFDFQFQYFLCFR